jgi:hypothetical protein
MTLNHWVEDGSGAVKFKTQTQKIYLYINSNENNGIKIQLLLLIPDTEYDDKVKAKHRNSIRQVVLQSGEFLNSISCTQESKKPNIQVCMSRWRK